MKKLSWFLVLVFLAFACDMQMGEETPVPANLNAEMATLPFTENEFYVVTLQEAGVPSGDYFNWTWSIQSKPGAKAISHVDFFELGNCATKEDIFNAAYSTDQGATWNTVSLNWATDNSQTCVTDPVLKFDQGGNIWIRLVLKVAYGVGENTIVVKSGAGQECSLMTIPGIGCLEAGGTVYEVICEGTPTALAGVTVELYQPVSATTPVTQVTNSDGTYLFTDLTGAPYKIVVPGAAPTEGYTRTGTSYGNDFTFYYYELGGYVYDNTCGTKLAVADVTVTLKLGTETIGTAVTNTNGYFVFTKLVKGNYTLSAEGYGSLEVSNLSSCIYNKELVKMIYEISGAVMQETCFDPIPYVGATVVLKLAGEPIANTTTGTDGTYKFSGLALGNYLVYVAGAIEENKEVAGTSLCAASVNFAFATTEVCNKCYAGETAWAYGNPYPRTKAGGGNWAMYTAYTTNDVKFVAGQKMDAGTISMSAVNDGKITITITLNEGWRFKPVMGNAHIQDYASAPTVGNPAPGQFMWKGNADGTSFSMQVKANNFYGIHADVEREVPCPE